MNKASESFLNAREAALNAGDASKYNAFDALYKAACRAENLEANGKAYDAGRAVDHYGREISE